MTTEPMSQFLEGLHASRLLETERIEELLRRPEPPQGDLDGVSRFLESEGWLTRFQIEEIREGRGHGLMFANYRLLERLPDHAGGRQFKAFHPALQKAVVVRFVNPEWLRPFDDLGIYIERAREASLVSHPNLVNVLDAGFGADDAFLVLEFVDGAELSLLVKEMGALPATLACDYVRQAALGLQAAHERGVYHGDLSPARLILSPVVRKVGVNGSGHAVSIRPSSTATIKVAETGLISRRPPVGEPSVDSPLTDEQQFWPPERFKSGEPSMQGDLYGLGATLYFLLAARPPLGGPTPFGAEPLRIDSVRRDVSPPLADLIQRMLARDPAARPSSAGSVAQYLQPFSPNRSGPTPPAPRVENFPEALPVASETDTKPNPLPAVMAAAVPDAIEVEVHEPLVEPLPAGTSDSQVFSPPSAHSDFHHEEDPFAVRPGAPSSGEPRRREKKEQPKHGPGMMILAIALHVIAIGGVLLWYFWPASTDKQSTNDPPARESKQPPPKKNPKK